MRIGVDVDLTVAQSDKIWFEWLCMKTGIRPTLPLNNINYNLGHYFAQICNTKGVDPLDFWRSTNVYTDMPTVNDSVEVLKELHEMGHEIVFISALKGDHHKSKYYWLKKNFPFMSGFVGTREKDLVDVDVLIDDRNNFLNSMNGSCLKFQIFTPYEQYEDPHPDVILGVGWLEILEFFKEEG